MPALRDKRQRDASVERPTYPRKRALRACRTCRQRRTKCDNEFPNCTSCLQLGVECYYQAQDKSSYDPASLAILQRLDELEALVRCNPAAQALHQADGHVRSPISNLGILAQTSPQSGVFHSLENNHLCNEAILSWPVFALDLTERLPDIKETLRENHGHIGSPTVLDFDTLQSSRLLQIFLDEFHIYNPILHVPTVQSYIEQIRLNGIGWDAKSCLLLLIYSLSSIAVPFSARIAEQSIDAYRSISFQQAEAFYSAAQKRLGILFSTNDEVSAQCFFLAGVYLMATFRPMEAWRMFVQALACSQCFTYPQVGAPADSDQSFRLRKSIWWTCFKSELELRWELNIDRNNTENLTYPDFFPNPPEQSAMHEESTWYYYLADIALRRLTIRLFNYLHHRTRHQATPNEIIAMAEDFERQADDWQQSLPPALKLGDIQSLTSESVDGHENVLRFILEGHLIDCYEMIYWPFVADAIHGNVYHEFNHFIKKALQNCVLRIEKNKRGFYHRHHGTWLMIRSCTRSALILLAASRSVAKDMLSNGWEESVHAVLQLLMHWANEAKDVDVWHKLLEKLYNASVADQSLHD